jgi:hypothetical protein
MNERSAPAHARVAAAEALLARGHGKVINTKRFALVEPAFYVYTVHDQSGALVYIGKGCKGRHLASAQRLNGRSRVRAEFDDERAALSFERRLIKRFNPRFNVVYRSVA